MTHAYNKIYLNDAQNVLGYMLDHAVYYMNIELSTFYEMFLSTGNARKIAKGDPFTVSGKSGIEICYSTLETMGISYTRKDRGVALSKSPEFWTGWVLAYYQWYCGKDFSKINQEVPIDRVFSMYMPYHEMDIMQFVDKMDDLRRQSRLMTYVKLYRKKLNLSQKDVSEASGIPLRTLQQYEQGQKNINHARADYVISLSKVLECTPVELLEQ